MLNLINDKLKTGLSEISLKNARLCAAWQIPSGWPDIRRNIVAGQGINLLATSLNGTYPNLGFTAAVTGGYSVYIDGVKYGDYASSAQCSLVWASYSATAGYAITSPAACTAHIIEIRPQSAGAQINTFKCNRVASSGNEQQGILWAHFNLSNHITLTFGFFGYDSYNNPLIQAITSATGELLCDSCPGFVGYGANYAAAYLAQYLKYVPALNMPNATGSSWAESKFGNCPLVILKNITNLATDFSGIFMYNAGLKKIALINCDTSRVSNWNNAHHYCVSLSNVPKEYNFASATAMANFLTFDTALQDTNLDVSAASGLTKIGCYGSAALPMRGFKGLKINSSAPFTGSAPQINVSYTGMVRAALVELFNELPTVSASQVCQITGSTGAADLTAADLAIATAKGWTVSA